MDRIYRVERNSFYPAYPEYPVYPVKFCSIVSQTEPNRMDKMNRL
jgi:hypothetical protein